MLALENINKSFKIRDGLQQDVLKGLNIEFPSKGFVSIVGESGSGKTTLLNILCGLDNLDYGNIYYRNKKVENFDTFRDEHLGVVYQEYNLINHLSALDNVILSMTDGPNDKKKKACNLLDSVGLSDVYLKKPKELSGGQQQRVAIARMMAKEVDIFVCDEPTGSLDAETSHQIVEILHGLSRDKLIIFVTHNISIAKEYSNKIIEIKEGVAYELEQVNQKNDLIYENNQLDKTEFSKDTSFSSFWLAKKNLLGTLYRTSKFIVMTTFIMLICALTVLLDSEVFKVFIHEQFLNQGIKNVIVEVHDEFALDEQKKRLENIDEINHVSYFYDSLIRFSPSDLGRGGKNTEPINSKVNIENVTQNEYIKEIITNGRFPESSDELLVSSSGAIAILRDLNIGGDRLYDKYMTGTVSSDDVFKLVDDMLFIISEYGYPRVKIVGLIDDRFVYESNQTIYFIHGFTKLFEYPNGLNPYKLKIYKKSIYAEDNSVVLNKLSEIKGVQLDYEHNKNSIRVYNKISSFLDLSRLGLVIVVIIVSISYISLVFTSTLNRKYEIGIYRTIGFSHKKIVKILGLELLLINFFSVLILTILLCILTVFFTGYTYSLHTITEVFININVINILTVEIILLAVFTLLAFLYSKKKVLNKTIIENLRKI